MLVSKKLLAGLKVAATEARKKSRTRGPLSEEEIVREYSRDIPPSKPKAAINPPYKRK